MTVIGASRPLPSVPTKVCLLNRLPTLDLGGGDYSSCSISDLRLTDPNRRTGGKPPTPRGSKLDRPRMLRSADRGLKDSHVVSTGDLSRLLRREAAAQHCLD